MYRKPSTRYLSSWRKQRHMVFDERNGSRVGGVLSADYGWLSSFETSRKSRLFSLTNTTKNSQINKITYKKYTLDSV